MASKLSPKGLTFISSWSLFSKTAFKIEQNINNTLYVGYCYYGSPLPYKIGVPVDVNTELSDVEALDILNQELISPTFDFIKNFDFTRFKQNELDALISICTTYRSSDYFNLFKTTNVYKALQENQPVDLIANLIKTDLPVPAEIEVDPKQYGVFYSITERRTHEANLFLNADYSPCTGLTAQKKVVNDIVIFY